jgi:hypothetical protein
MPGSSACARNGEGGALPDAVRYARRHPGDPPGHVSRRGADRPARELDEHEHPPRHRTRRSTPWWLTMAEPAVVPAALFRLARLGVCLGGRPDLPGRPN